MDKITLINNDHTQLVVTKTKDSITVELKDSSISPEVLSVKLPLGGDRSGYCEAFDNDGQHCLMSVRLQPNNDLAMSMYVDIQSDLPSSRGGGSVCYSLDV